MYTNELWFDSGLSKFTLLIAGCKIRWHTEKLCLWLSMEELWQEPLFKGNLQQPTNLGQAFSRAARQRSLSGSHSQLVSRSVWKPGWGLAQNPQNAAQNPLNSEMSSEHRPKVPVINLHIQFYRCWFRPDVHCLALILVFCWRSHFFSKFWGYCDSHSARLRHVGGSFDSFHCFSLFMLFGRLVKVCRPLRVEISTLWVKSSFSKSSSGWWLEHDWIIFPETVRNGKIIKIDEL